MTTSLPRAGTWDDLVQQIPEGFDDLLERLLEDMAKNPGVPHEIGLQGPVFEVAQEARRLGLVDFIGNGVLILKGDESKARQPQLQQAYRG